MIKNKAKLKGFDDLTFGQHGGFADGKARQARLTFGQRDKDNQDQFTISVVQNLKDGNGLYGHINDNTFEVAMWFQDRNDMLPLSVSDDVLGWQTPTDITRLMHQAQLNDFAWVTLLHKLRDDFRKDLGLD
tara:strand:+ start:2025 stop:2417 length:393 start_codon:yes stop_codon:yes gene_type:complete